MIAIGAHPYDIELGCGASLARLINDGYHVV
ncbi:PIG-L family deacetylase, partial [Escherichia coli]